MIRLCQKQTNIIIILFLAVRFLKEGEDLFAGFFDLGSGSYYCYLFVFLLDVVEWVVYFFEGDLAADAEFGHAGLFF